MSQLPSAPKKNYLFDFPVAPRNDSTNHFLYFNFVNCYDVRTKKKGPSEFPAVNTMIFAR